MVKLNIKREPKQFDQKHWEQLYIETAMQSRLNLKQKVKMLKYTIIYTFIYFFTVRLNNKKENKSSFNE